MKNVSLLIIGAIIGALATYYFCPNCAGHEDVVEDIIKPAGVITSKEAMVLDEAFNWMAYVYIWVLIQIHQKKALVIPLCFLCQLVRKLYLKALVCR
mgnify:CR=1 FL=1